MFSLDLIRIDKHISCSNHYLKIVSQIKSVNGDFIKCKHSLNAIFVCFEFTFC